VSCLWELVTNSKEIAFLTIAYTPHSTHLTFSLVAHRQDEVV
jgi:hypothetical protein